MKKGLFISIGGLVLALWLVAACTPLPGAPPGTEGAAAPAQGEVVELRHMIWDLKQEDVVRQQIALFEEEHPNIKIKLEIVPHSQYDDKLQTALAAGTAPDTFWQNMGGWLDFASRGALLDITPYIEADPDVQADLDMLLPNLREFYTLDGRMYGFPRDWDTISLVYNKTLFDEAGVAYPDESWTWDDMYEAAQKLTQKEGDRTTVFGAMLRPSFQEGWGNFLYSNGGAILNEDRTQCLLTQPEALEAFEAFTRFTLEGLSPDQEALEAMNHVEWFMAGRAAMRPTGDWRLSKFIKEVKDFEWDVAPLPMAPRTGERVSVIHGLVDTIAGNTKHPDEAFQWVSFLLRKEVSGLLGETLTVIPARGDTADLFFKPEFPPSGRHYYRDIADSARPFAYTRKAPASLLFKQINDVMPLMLSGEMSVTDGLTQACEQIDQILAESGQ